jgi:hypothetical protein
MHAINHGRPLSPRHCKVGAVVKAPGFPLGTIMTKENCWLNSFTGKLQKWPCWTVRTEAAKPKHKYLLCDLKKDGLILWKKSTRRLPPAKAKIWWERSGFEQMENIDTPKAGSYKYSMLVYVLAKKNNKPSKLYAIETMHDGQVFRYDGLRLNT